MRPRSTLLLATSLLFAPLAARAEETRAAPYQLEIGPSLAVIDHVARDNDDGIRYGTAFTYEAFVFRVTATPWLKLSLRYTRSFHTLTLPAYALGTTATLFQAGSAKVDSLDGYVHPTWSPADPLHLWLTLGIGWATMRMPPIQVQPPDGATLGTRSGVFLEVPFGAGAAWDAIPKWLTVSYDFVYAPAFLQSGDAFSEQSFVNRQGLDATARPFPKLSGSFYQLLSLCLPL